MGASESKLAFKEDIFRLAGEDNIPAGSDWWDKVSALHVTRLWQATFCISITSSS